MRPSSKRLSCSRLLRSFLDTEYRGSTPSNLPLYLCPAAARVCSPLPRAGSRKAASTRRQCLPLNQNRKLHVEATETVKDDGTVALAVNAEPVRKLPAQCYGCGALSQTVVPDKPGYYDPSRKAVKSFLGLVEHEGRPNTEQDIVRASLLSLSKEKLEEIGVDPALLAPKGAEDENTMTGHSAETDVPLCDRCHRLVHHHSRESIYHPTIDAIRDTIEESPYKYNHVYHILDAADFPMSLLPKVHQLLDLSPLRSKNRRSRGGKFHKGKSTEMSFIITRSDLLAPKKEAVDRMMPYLVETLRDALPRDSRNVRLGNVRCVSAKRSWWTKELKEDIWKRGGAGWLVGKVNVGKSQLLHTVFPKGRMDWKDPKESKQAITVAVEPGNHKPDQAKTDPILPEIDDLDEESLLPPPQPETNYPQMPLVSALPGTTASPIRLPFGGGKGELIDLPGLARGDLETFVREEHRSSLIMKARMTPEQQVIKPGRSLLVGGFIRITPRTPDLIFLAYAFTPIDAHLTATDKAIEIQNQTSDLKVENIAVPGVGEKIEHAGEFRLKYDVTKRRAGPITRKDAVGMKAENLPYRVLSIDILIEGCGWVEITAQARAKNLFGPAPPRPSAKGTGGEEILQSLNLSEPGAGRNTQVAETAADNEPNWPVVDVYSPEGRFIGSRPPMNAWLYNKLRKTDATSKVRPRRSMTGVKKREKQAQRSKS